MTSPHWMTNQDGGNGTHQALKPLVVLDESKLSIDQLCALGRDGFDVGAEVLSAWAQALAAEARKEGRREVLREIASLPSPLRILATGGAERGTEYRETLICDWCEWSVDVTNATRPSHPQNNCLWLRAQEATKE